jgi:chitinase
MDVATPVSLFEDVAALKITKPDLKIYVSIGGWTFSDNGTETQAVFGDIAKSATNRATFAKKVMAFLDEYGFDGVDLDW